MFPEEIPDWLIFKECQSFNTGSKIGRLFRAKALFYLMQNLAYLVGFKTLDSLLFLLFSENNEGATVFVECKTHFMFLE